jgi:predicted alpha/beta superfamily hydrolase
MFQGFARRLQAWVIGAVAAGGCVDADSGRSPVEDPAVEGPSVDTPSPGDTATTPGATEAVVRVRYSPGLTLTLRGSGGPLAWDRDLAMVEIEPGVYAADLDGVASTLEFKPLRDGEDWSVGPNYHVAPGQAVEVAPRFQEGAGSVTLLNLAVSSTLGDERPVWVYLPPSYAENTAARFPVVYMHDGQNLFDAGSAFGGVEWGVDEALDVAAGLGVCPTGEACLDDGACGGARCDTFREAIVVGVGNTAARIDEYTPTVDAEVGGGGGAAAYVAALADGLAPAIDLTFRTRVSAGDTAIVGSSLGGLVSLHAGLTRPDAFGLVGALSPSTWWDERVILDEVAALPAGSARPSRVYVDSGDAGPSRDGVDDTAELASALQRAGYTLGEDLRYLVAPGDTHTEAAWRERLPGALAFLLGPRERDAE